MGNPLKYTDPTGHASCVGDNYDDGPQCFRQNSLPDWDPLFEKYVSPEDQRAAEQAYMRLAQDPGHFASLYVDPGGWVGNKEVAALEIIAEYSSLHTTASNLVLSAFRPESANLLRRAQTRNITDPGSAIVSGGVVLFRAVSGDEFSDVMATGAFAPNPTGFDGKWFAESAADASKWGKLMSKWTVGDYHVLAVDLNEDVANSMMRISKLDNIGPARYADDLDALNSGITGIWEVPK